MDEPVNDPAYSEAEDLSCGDQEGTRKQSASNPSNETGTDNSKETSKAAAPVPAGQLSFALHLVERPPPWNARRNSHTCQRRAQDYGYTRAKRFVTDDRSPGHADGGAKNEH